MNAVKIPKEQVKDLSFAHQEVLTQENERKLRNFYLEKAAKLGNLHKQKVEIEFYDAQGQSYWVNTTVWSVGEDFVTLKGGTTLPIKAIAQINF
jgi:hypothetical protein